MPAWIVIDRRSGESRHFDSAEKAAVRFSEILEDYDLASPDPIALTPDVEAGNIFDVPGIAVVGPLMPGSQIYYPGCDCPPCQQITEIIRQEEEIDRRRKATTMADLTRNTPQQNEEALAAAIAEAAEKEQAEWAVYDSVTGKEAPEHIYATARARWAASFAYYSALQDAQLILAGMRPQGLRHFS